MMKKHIYQGISRFARYDNVFLIEMREGAMARFARHCALPIPKNTMSYRAKRDICLL